MEGVIEDEVTEEVGAETVTIAAVTSSDFSITSARQLRVELRALEIMTGFRLSVLLLDALLELVICVSPINLASYLRFLRWLLLMEERLGRECGDGIEASFC